MIERILVVRLGSLGDLVHTLPAVSALRRAHPAAEIDWLVDAPHREFLELVPILNRLIVLTHRGTGAWLAARRTMRGRRYDVAIDFQGLVKSAALARMSGAARVVGFDRAALRESLAAMFYTERAGVIAGAHVIQKNLQLAERVGARSTPLEFPIATFDSPAIDAFMSADTRAFALINPGAAWPNKRWPPDRFGHLAREVLAAHGLRSVVLWGPNEQETAAAVVSASAGAAQLAPPTGLKELIALARRARVIVSGDTGPLHIACALGIPAVSVFGPTNPARNGPWNQADLALSRYEHCDCHYERRCRRSDAEWCLRTIAVDEVAAGIKKRLLPPGRST